MTKIAILENGKVGEFQIGGGGDGLVTRSCPTLATPWIVACQAPLSMGCSRQEYWSGMPFPSPEFQITRYQKNIRKLLELRQCPTDKSIDKEINRTKWRIQKEISHIQSPDLW